MITYPQTPNWLAKLCLGLAVFVWLGDVTRSTFRAPGSVWGVYLCAMVFSLFAANAKSAKIAIPSGMAWCYFAYHFAIECDEVIQMWRLHLQMEAAKAM
jgi:hypothetical protein